MPWDGESVGELQVRGPWITGAYYGVDNSDSFDDGWLRTGDVGYIKPEGFLQLTDRAKDVIKSGGEWISSIDMENSIMDDARVLEAAVIAVPDEKWDERPAAYVVLRDGESVTADEIREGLLKTFAKWQLPDTIEFVAELPRTSVGKLDKKVLRSQHLGEDAS